MAQQLVKMKFTKVRNLQSLGRTAWMGDIAMVPYDEALDCINCEVAYPCNDDGGEEAMPERAEPSSMEEATSLIDHSVPELGSDGPPAVASEAVAEVENEVLAALDPVHEEADEEIAGDPRLGEDNAPRKKRR